MSEGPAARPAAPDFLYALFGNTVLEPENPAFIEFRLIGLGKAVPCFFTPTQVFENWPVIEKRLLEANRKGANIYFGVNPRRPLWTTYWTEQGKKSHRGFGSRPEAEAFAKEKGTRASVSEKPVPHGSIEYVRSCQVLWADLDYKGELSQKNAHPLKGLGLSPSTVVDSGRGYHLYWFLKEPIALTQAEKIMRRIAKVLVGDHTYDAPRILRLPGTLNVKDPEHPIPCRLMKLDPERQFTPMDFDELENLPAGVQPEKKKKPAKEPVKSISGAQAQTLITAGNGHGLAHAMSTALLPFWKKAVRHKLAMGIAGMLQKEDIKESDAVDVVQAIVTAANDPEIIDRLKAVRTTYQRDPRSTAAAKIVEEALGKDQAKRFFGIFNTILKALPPPPIERPGFPEFNLYACTPPGSLFDKHVMWASRYSDAPPQFHLASIVTAAAACLGNHVWIPYYGGKKLFPNLYTLIIGPPGRFRKSTAIMQAKEAADSAHVDVYPHEATVEQLYASMASRVCEETEVDVGGGRTKSVATAWEGEPSGIIYHSEFSRYLSASSKSYMQDSRSFFTDLYDGGHLIRETKSKGKYYIKNPAISLLCGVTPASLKRSITRGDIEDGFLSRFLIIMQPPENPCQYELHIDEDPTYVDLKSDVSDLLSRMKHHGGIIRISEEADQIRQKFERWIDTRGSEYESAGNDQLDSLTGRLKAMASKVALVYATGSQPPPVFRINAATMTYATNLCRYVALTMEYLFESIRPDDGNREIRFRDQVLEVLRRWAKKNPGKSIPHRVLLWQCRLDADQMRRALDSLHQEGRIHKGKTPSGRGLTYLLNEKECQN